MRNKLTSVKNHIHNNRAKYAAGATATIAGIFIVNRAATWNEFLKEHNLYDEFYQMNKV